MADEHIWVIDRRMDGRVVLWERDPMHPGGEAFVAAGAPTMVGKTAEVERLMRDGFLMEVPEPKDGRKKPAVLWDATPTEPAPAQPGEPVRLGRQLDPELFGEEGASRAAKAEERLPDEAPVPAGVVVPPAEQPERARSRR